MDGIVTIKTEIDNTSFDKQISVLEDKLETLLEEYDAIDKASPFEGQTDELLKIQREIDSTRRKISKLKDENKKIDFSSWGSAIQKATKKITKMALAVFGIRSAYMFVRNAINTIAEQDEQLKADIDGIRVALAYTIEPVVKTIVNLVKTLMGYVAYIVKAWTGRDIFEKTKNNLASANKSAKQLQKNSASFDKFNKIGSSSSSGGATISANLDIPSDEEMEHTFIGWIARNKDIVLASLTAIATGLLAIKILTLAIGATNPVGWIALIISALSALAVMIALNWEKVKAIMSSFGNWVKTKVIDPTINLFSKMREKIVGIFSKIGKAVGEVIGGNFKLVINGVLKAIEAILNTPIKAVNKLINTINKVPGINIGKLPTFNLPRLERGGIVHNPGSGVMMGRYIAGEGRSPEAVIPLDDATLDRLGLAFARHTEINATIVNEMDSRVLSRNLAKVRNEEAFARNGGY